MVIEEQVLKVYRQHIYYVCGNSHVCFSLCNQEEPAGTAAIQSEHRRILLRTVDTYVVVLVVRLTQETFEVVDELIKTVNFSCNHRLEHGINLSGTR